MKYHFNLYIAGRSERSKQFIETMQERIQDRFNSEAVLEVIDLIDSPEKAEEMKVVVTPTLVRMDPEPRVRVIGFHMVEEKHLMRLQ